MLNVTLIQRPTEAELRRKTVLLNGRQCGYLFLDGPQLAFIEHFDDETAAVIRAEVERLEAAQIVKHCMPEPTPPEFLPEAEEEEPSRLIIP